MTLLPEIYYDFTCQDLTPKIEDAHGELWAPEQRWLVRVLNWKQSKFRR